MIKVLFLTFLLMCNVSVNADALYQYNRNLDLESATQRWLNQQVTRQSDQTLNLVTNHLLFNASTQDVPIDLIIGVAMVESRFNPKAESPQGAKGIMQVVPRYHQNKIHGRNIFDPRVGLEVGTQILKECLETAHGSHRLALNCYSGYRGKAALKYQHSVLKQANLFKDFVAQHQFNRIELAQLE